jgi:hypothetical protein
VIQARRGPTAACTWLPSQRASGANQEEGVIAHSCQSPLLDNIFFQAGNERQQVVLSAFGTLNLLKSQSG